MPQSRIVCANDRKWIKVLESIPKGQASIGIFKCGGFYLHRIKTDGTRSTLCIEFHKRLDSDSSTCQRGLDSGDMFIEGIAECEQTEVTSLPTKCSRGVIWDKYFAQGIQGILKRVAFGHS